MLANDNKVASLYDKGGLFHNPDVCTEHVPPPETVASGPAWRGTDAERPGAGVGGRRGGSR